MVTLMPCSGMSRTHAIKVFQQSVIPLKNGAVPLPASTFSYFDPLAKDEQGRRVIDTPAAYTPNKAMKLPATEKPWWMPLVGVADIASNFIAPGAGTAGKVAMAAASIGGARIP